MSKDNAALQAKAHAKVWAFEAKATGSEAKATDEDHNNLALRPKPSLEDPRLLNLSVKL